MTTKTDRMRELEAKYGKPIEQLFGEMLRGGLSQRQIAQEVGVSEAAISKWLVRLGFRIERVVLPPR